MPACSRASAMRPPVAAGSETAVPPTSANPLGPGHELGVPGRGWHSPGVDHDQSAPAAYSAGEVLDRLGCHLRGRHAVAHLHHREVTETEPHEALADTG